MNFPAEIWLQILSHVIGYPELRCVWNNAYCAKDPDSIGKPPSYTVLTVFYVNKELYTEAKDILYK